MSVTRSLIAVAASIALISALCVPMAQLAPAADAISTATEDGDAIRAGGELPAFKPVARISSIMRGIGSAMGDMHKRYDDISDEHRIGAITADAEIVAELSNVHMRHRREADYLAMAADTRSIALDLARAARADAPDEARMGSLIATLDASCGTCHDAQ